MSYLRIAESEQAFRQFGCGPGSNCAASPQAGGSAAVGEHYLEEEDDEEYASRQRVQSRTRPERMRTGVAGFGYVGDLAQGPYQLRPPGILERPQPAWRSRLRFGPTETLQMPPYDEVTGFAPNMSQLTGDQRQRVQSIAQRIAASWRTTSPIVSLRFSGFMLNSETVPRLDVQRGVAVREALVEALRALDPNLPNRIRWEPDEPRGLTGRAPRVDIYAWMGFTPPPPRTPYPRIPPPSELTPGSLPGLRLGPETIEERLNRILRTLPPAPAQRGRSFNQWFWNEVDTRLNSLMRRAGIPQSLQPYLRQGAHAAIERGAEAVFNQVLDAAELRGEPREALSTTVRALLQTPIR